MSDCFPLFGYGDWVVEELDHLQSEEHLSVQFVLTLEGRIGKGSSLGSESGTSQTCMLCYPDIRTCKMNMPLLALPPLQGGVWETGEIKFGQCPEKHTSSCRYKLIVVVVDPWHGGKDLSW